MLVKSKKQKRNPEAKALHAALFRRKRRVESKKVYRRRPRNPAREDQK